MGESAQVFGDISKLTRYQLLIMIQTIYSKIILSVANVLHGISVLVLYLKKKLLAK
jgi:hypothetical protein